MFKAMAITRKVSTSIFINNIQHDCFLLERQHETQQSEKTAQTYKHISNVIQPFPVENENNVLK